MNTVECFELRKIFRETAAVNGLSFSVRTGEVFGFLGPNGAGKTTTIKMLLGLVHPTSGGGTVLGRPFGSIASLGRIGFLPEHFRFPPWFTAREFLDFAGRLHGMPGRERRTRMAEVLETVGLGEHADRKLGQYSKGMSQRVGLAQALINRPEVIFLDEPTSGLDPLGRVHFMEIIRGLRRSGVTVFLNSHLLGEVEATCDRVAVIKEGRLAREGTLSQLTGPRVLVEVWLGTGNEGQAGKRVLEGFGKMVEDGNRNAAPAFDPSRAGDPSPIVAPSRAGDPSPIVDPSPVDVPNSFRILLEVDSSGTIPEMTAALVGCGARVHAITPRRPSLEEMFVRIMEES